MKDSSNKKNVATAAYNFVPLLEKIIPSEIESAAPEAFKKHIDNNGKLSGTIELSISTRSPLFIGGGSGENSFSPIAGRPIIPGSSLRGMTKNIFKIITGGAMRSGEDFDDQKLYFRGVGASKNAKSFQEYYKKQLRIKMDTVNKTSETGARAGFIVKENDAYFMYDAGLPNPQPLAGADKPNTIEVHDGYCDCYTGAMQKKKHFCRLPFPDWNSRKLPVPMELMDDYRSDIRRGNVNKADEDKEGNAIDLCKVLKNHKGKYNNLKELAERIGVDAIAPCFYMTDSKDNILHFGFGRFYRVPYTKTVVDHVPEGLQTAVVDFADAVFGKKELWASRVFFEDAELIDAGSKEDLKADYSHLLLSPNPTSFQLYLQQQSMQLPGDESKPTPPSSSAKHWGENTPIRGYKMYWHKRKVDWQAAAEERKNIANMLAKDKNPEKPSVTRIKPLNYGKHFHSCIRFNDLSRVELGALLSVFELSHKFKDAKTEGCYKIGKGKSLGLGSISIDYQLKLQQEDYYLKLFDTDDWKREETAEPLEYLTAFDEYIRKKCNTRMQAAYDISMGELRHLLAWNKVKDEYTRSMDGINHPDKPFVNRWILPTATNVMSGKEYPR